ncbi:hypothetical protein KSP40_PGU006628 [Platanthera guangdongensis]|uniref:Calmodulin binding protein-like N-terminal domain-containing protein n=1 Tax=Platanthera guangdongensis TaxID=2320717 RepID=A0ABR2MP79_9ASPA
MRFRLGLKISSGYCDGIRVREGKTEAFTVKDHRGESVVWWLKIKAAMRWGIFIRKKAAERRAQIIELEDK